MHADNAGMKVGDKISVSGKEFKITGLIAYVNYSTLHEKRLILCLMRSNLTWQWSLRRALTVWIRASIIHMHGSTDHAPADDIEEKEQSDSFMEAVVTQVMLAGNDMEDYTPKYGNPAINFATDDMGSDKAMGGIFA